MYCPYCEVHYTLEEPCFCQQSFRSNVEVSEPSQESGVLKAAILNQARNSPRPAGRRGANHG